MTTAVFLKGILVLKLSSSRLYTLKHISHDHHRPNQEAKAFFCVIISERIGFCSKTYKCGCSMLLFSVNCQVHATIIDKLKANGYLNRFRAMLAMSFGLRAPVGYCYPSSEILKYSFQFINA